MSRRLPFRMPSKKRQCEAIIEAAGAAGDFATTIIRPAYTYGEGRGMLSTFGGGPDYLGRLRAGRCLWSCMATARTSGRPATATMSPTPSSGLPGTRTGLRQGVPRRGRGVAAVGHLSRPRRCRDGRTTARSWCISRPIVLARALPDKAWITRENFRFNNIFDTAAARADLDFASLRRL